jgi:hypothetical protein
MKRIPAKIFWHQHAIRRAAMAVKHSRSSDLFTLAWLALEAAIRDAVDLAALLLPSTPQRPLASQFRLQHGTGKYVQFFGTSFQTSD